MMTYNLTNLTNAKSFVDVLVFSNNIVGGILGLLIILGIWIIILSNLIFRGHDFRRALLYSTFTSTLVSYMLVVIGILAPQVSVVLTIATLLAGVI